MSKSVLCAIDISQPEIDKHVLLRAAELADMDGATLDVISVVPSFGMSIVSGYFDQSHHDKAVEAANTALGAFIVETLGEDAKDKVRHAVATGSAYEQILGIAAKTDCDLIVIGSHKPEMSDYLLGPNAARVVRHSTCSVFVVR